MRELIKETYLIVKKEENQEIILYTTKDIQAIFKCGKRQAYALVNSSGFPTLWINNKILVPKDKLEKWISVNVGNIVTF